MNKKIKKLIEIHELKKLFLKYKEESISGKDRNREIEELLNYIESNFFELKNCINIKTAYELGKIIENSDISKLNLWQIDTNFVIYIYGMFMPMIGYIDKRILNIDDEIEVNLKDIKNIKIQNCSNWEEAKYRFLRNKEIENGKLKENLDNYKLLRSKIVDDYNSLVKYFTKKCIHLKNRNLIGKELETIPFYKEIEILSTGKINEGGTFKNDKKEIEDFCNAISAYMLGHSIMIRKNEEKLIKKYEELVEELSNLILQSKKDKKRAKLLLKLNETLN